MKDNTQPAKRRRYDAAFRAEALCLAEQSRLCAFRLSEPILVKSRSERSTFMGYIASEAIVQTGDWRGYDELVDVS